MEETVNVMTDPTVMEEEEQIAEAPTEVKGDNSMLFVAGLVSLVVTGVAVVAHKLFKNKKTKSKKHVAYTKEEEQPDADETKTEVVEDEENEG